MKSSKSNTQLNEKDALLDLLESEKQLMSFYTTALFEGSTKSIRKGFASHLSSVAENQYLIWNQMTTRGFVQPALAQKQMIDQTCDQFKKQKKSLAQ